MYDSTPNVRGGGRGGERGGGRASVAAAAGDEAVWAGGTHKYEYFTVPWSRHVAAPSCVSSYDVSLTPPY